MMWGDNKMSDNQETKTENGKDAESQEQAERKLTSAEQKRLEQFQKTAEELRQQGYVMKDLTTTSLKANVLGMLYGVILAVIIFVIGFVCGGRLDGMESSLKGMATVLLFIILIVVHELIHGITWGLLVKGGIKKNIEFGFIVQSLTPYCTCKAPMGKVAYILGSLMPCIVLGILPAIAGFILSDMLIYGLGALMIISAGGDLLVTQMILTHKTDAKEVLFFDHPTEIGLMTFER